jgi:hypothetical protein
MIAGSTLFAPAHQYKEMDDLESARFNVSLKHKFHSAAGTHDLAGQSTRCGNKETGLLLLLISDHVDDEEEGRKLTRGLPSTATQRFIYAHRLVLP